ncbi:MAG TPA: hypothetical protein VF482_09215, partial [Trebonia sp.]
GEQVMSAGASSAFAAARGGGDTYVTVHVHAPVGSSSRDRGRELAGHLAQYVKGGGRIYPAGMAPR